MKRIRVTLGQTSNPIQVGTPESGGNMLRVEKVDFLILYLNVQTAT